jgi:hypothetical protein
VENSLLQQSDAIQLSVCLSFTANDLALHARDGWMVSAVSMARHFSWGI